MDLTFTQEEFSVSFFTHDIFCLDVRAVKRIRGCVADFMLIVVYSDYRSP